MKHILTHITMFVFIVMSTILLGDAHAQKGTNNTNTPVVIMTPNPSPFLSDWQLQRECIRLNVMLAQPMNQPVKLMAQVSLNGQVVARTKQEKMPLLTLQQGMNSFVAADIIPIQAVTFMNGIDQVSQRTGKLPEGNYEICIWFANAETGFPLISAPCQPFTIQQINPVTLISPQDGAQFTAGNQTSVSLRPNVIIAGKLKNHTTNLPGLRAGNNFSGIVFNWLPPMPVLPGQVQYKLRIVGVYGGQSSQEAINISTPIVDRTLSTPFYAVEYLSDEYFKFGYAIAPSSANKFAWAVQAIDASGKSIGANNGWSEVRTFTFKTGMTETASPLLASELPWDPKRKLGGDDFKGTPPKGSELSAESGVYFKVYYDSTKKAWVVVAIFDTNESWMTPDGKKDAALINHEQRHFDLAELFARKLRKKIKDLPKKDQTQENIDKLVGETADEMNKEQQKYDKETDHGTNEEKQKEWDKNIDKEMEKYKGYAS